MKPVVYTLTSARPAFRRISAMQALFAGLAGAALLFAAQKPGLPWDAPARAAARVNPVAADADARAKGKVIYDKMCASCHGKTGRGDGSGSKDLDVSPSDFTTKLGAQSDGALFWKITEGRKPMPSYETKLTDDERWQAIVYLRTFTAAKPESAAK